MIKKDYFAARSLFTFCFLFVALVYFLILRFIVIINLKCD